MRADGSLDYPRLKSLVDFHVAEGTDGIVIVGTTGESPTVDVDEHCELIRAAVEAMDSLAPRDVEIITAAISDDDELRRVIAPAPFRKRLERAFARLRTSWRSRHGTL